MKQTQERRQQKNTQKEGGMQMKYKVTLKVGYKDPEFLFDDRCEAMDFAELAWAHRIIGEDKLDSVKLTFVEEEA